MIQTQKGYFLFIAEFLGCEAGQYFSSGICENCKQDTYNSIKGTKLTECTICPTEYQTTGTGSTSAADCRCKFQN